MERIALLFPGQGTQYLGMAKDLCNNFLLANQTFIEASDALGYDLKKMCNEGSEIELTKTENAQPAILTACYAMFRVYMNEINMNPCILAGHSLGEITALSCSGAIDFVDAVKIARKRGEFMRDAVSLDTGMMAAICGLDIDTINKECESYTNENGVVSISNYNSSRQLVISGQKENVLEVSSKLENLGAKVIKLKVSAPFHSILMKDAALKLKNELENYTYHDFKWPVISNVDAMPYTGKDSIITNLVKQVTSPVQWQKTLSYMIHEGATVMVDLGPKSTLKRFIKEDHLNVKTCSYANREDAERLSNMLTLNTDSSNIEDDEMKILKNCLAAAVCTPNKNWNDEEYTDGVIKPYKQLQQLVTTAPNDGIKINREQVKESVKLLEKIFITKKLPKEEQDIWFRKIIENTNVSLSSII